MYGMLKEGAKVAQSRRQIAIQPDLFAAQPGMGAAGACNPIRRLHVPQSSPWQGRPARPD